MGWTFYNASGEALTSFGPVALTDLDIDGGTAIGEAVVGADLFIMDNGAGGTNVKVTATEVSTFILPGQECKAWAFGTDSALTDNYNIAGISNDSAGVNTYTIDIDMGNTNYMVVTGTDGVATNDSRCIYSGNRAAGSFKLYSSVAGSAGSLSQYAAVFGDR